jgi:hypothetical protein
MISARSRGYILLLALVFIAVFLSVAAALMTYVMQYSASGRYRIAERQAVYLAEAGIDKAVYSLNQNQSYSGESNTVLGSGRFTVAVTNAGTNTKRIVATGEVVNNGRVIARRKVTANAAINTSVVAFRFGVQVGIGGLTMDNNSSVVGNVYASGNITGSQATVTGDATVSGASGLLSGITVGGNAWAHTLSNCSVAKNAYYTTISSCPVTGTKFPSSTNAEDAEMPIMQEEIDEWEETAEDGGVIAGPYTVSGTQILGPKKINGNLIVNGTLYLTGPVWVAGNITFGNNSSLIVHTSVGNAGAVLIADVPGSESSQGTIVLSNNMTISGNGQAGSFPMLLSTNSSGNAIDLSNNATGVILYAPNGTIQVSNNGGANQITAKRLHLNNNASIEYVTGLQSQSFSNGPGGAWVFVPGTYSISN